MDFTAIVSDIIREHGAMKNYDISRHFEKKVGKGFLLATGKKLNHWLFANDAFQKVAGKRWDLVD